MLPNKKSLARDLLSYYRAISLALSLSFYLSFFLVFFFFYSFSSVINCVHVFNM